MVVDVNNCFNWYNCGFHVFLPIQLNQCHRRRRSNNMSKRIAYFISPHGFGHAARASAVMAAIHKTDPHRHFEIFTTVPPWFFEDSIGDGFSHHPVLTDIGLVQKTPLCADLPGTVECLDRFIPFTPEAIREQAEQIERTDCALVICDVAPMGIVVAREAGVPSVLVENFTWDWVYQEYFTVQKGLMRHADYLKSLFSRADYHVQTQPVCLPGAVDLTVAPVSRSPRNDRNEIRARLGIPVGARLLLVTMGGVPEDYGFMETLTLPEDLYLVIPGADRSFHIHNHRISLPHRSAFFHPDLVAAADGVIGKIGYSTLAEIYHGGVPFGFIKRSNFQESHILADYVEKHMSGFAIEEERFRAGKWVVCIPRLLEIPRIRRRGPNGAEQIAEFVLSKI
jgi:hypothetical protein